MPQTSRPVTQRRLDLVDLEFGKTDARYEVITRNISEIEHFRQSYFEPTGIKVDEFKDGSRFYVHGSKGAGKTALLRYVQLEVEKEGCLTHFVTFSTDIVEEQRLKFLEGAGIKIVDQNADPGASAINVWLMYAFRLLSEIIESDNKMFDNNRDTANFCGIVKTFHEGEQVSSLAWLTDMVKKGKYRFKAKHFDAKLQGELAEKDRNVDITQVVETCFSLLKSLSWEGPRAIYIFFDELNLSFSSRVQHKRDTILIRDLILAIDRLNSFFIREHKQIYVMAAARSEVIQALSVPTHEVTKCLTDRGREIRWFARTAGLKSPIVSLFEKKVQTSERTKKRPVSENVMEAYFRRSIYGFSPEMLIIELTWCNPRDIINLFGAAAKSADGEYFDEKAIEKIMEEYSAKSWDEKTEELNVEYAAAEVTTLKRILINCGTYFRKSDFDKVVEGRSKEDDGIRVFKNKSSSKVLENLYRIGIIGQSTRRNSQNVIGSKQFEEHWAYRGETNFDPDGHMVLHRAIWKTLRHGSPFSNK